MSLPLPPNAAIEQACVEILRATLGYQVGDCDRSFDGRPTARGGLLFVAIWSDMARQSRSRVALDETFGVSATVTVQGVEPQDRWHLARDRAELQLNRVRAAIHGDTWGGAIRRRANELAGLGDAASRNVGFSEALYLLSVESWQERGGDWFGGRGQQAGLSITARFGGMRLVQSVPTAR
jgi:hypothetical protein